MRLAVTAKLLSSSKQIRLLCNFLLVLFLQVDVLSQDLKLTFTEETPLSEALVQSSGIFHFKVAFDAQRLSAVYVKKEVSGNGIEEFLSDLLGNTGFKFLYKYGSYLIIPNEEESPTEIGREYILQGSVIDAESGEQLPYASISLPDQNINVMATSSGTFSIKNIISNPVHIVVNYIGYSTADTMLKWTDYDTGIQIKLRSQITRINSVDIVRNKLDIIEYRDNVDFATTVNPAKLIDIPALVETDIFRALQLLPGIKYAENSSELSIRGGTSDQNLVLFDGQTLYNLSHYYGVFSSVNPNIVKDIQVYKGGFDSRYGERISAIVDIKGKSGNHMKPALSADVNLLSVNLAVEVPITKKLTIIAAGRRSYSDIYKTSFAGKLFDRHSQIFRSKPDDTVTVSEPSFHFYDINTKLNYRFSSNENLSISLYAGKDFFKNSYKLNSHAIYVENADSNSWYNYGISINWQKQWNPSFYSDLLVGSSGYTNSSQSRTDIKRLVSDGQEQQFLPDSQNVFRTQNRNELKDLAFSLRNTYLLNSFNQLDFGFSARWNDILYYKDADKVYVYDNFKQSAFISSVYMQDHISVLKNMVFKPGLRLSYFGGTRKIYFEPRFAASYNFSDQLSFRIAAGRYNQFISQVVSQQETGYIRSFWVLANDSVNPVLNAVHYVLGLSYEKKKFLLNAEGYYKRYSGLQEYIFLSQFLRNTDFGNYFPPEGSDPPPENLVPTPPSYFISGSGKSYGLDLFLSIRSAYYTNWLSYSLSKSVQQFDMINYGEEIPSITDQTHQVSFTNMFSLGKWNLGAIFLFQTGMPFVVASENEMHPPIIREYDRLPNYFRCDLSANYSFLIKLVHVKAGISIINLFNNQNYLDINTRTFDFENTSFSETNLIRSQKLSLNVFLHINL